MFVVLGFPTGNPGSSKTSLILYIKSCFSRTDRALPKEFGYLRNVERKGDIYIAGTYGRYDYEPETDITHSYKPKGYEQKYELFDPEVVSIHVYISKSLLTGEGQVGKKTYLSDHLGENEEFIQEGNAVFVISRTKIEDDEGDEGLWKEVSIRNMEEVLNRARKDGVERQEQLVKHLGTYQFIGTLEILSCGSNKNYWTEPQVDLSAFLADAKARETFSMGMSSTLKIDILNQAIYHSEEIRGAAIRSLPFDVTLFAFPEDDQQLSGSGAGLPTRLFLDYDIEEESDEHSSGSPESMSLMDDLDGISIITDGGVHDGSYWPGNPPPPEDDDKGTGQEKEGIRYRTHIDGLLNMLSRYIGFQMAFKYLHSENLNDYMRSAAKIRKDIQGLQSDINALLLADEGGKKTKAGTGKGSKEGRLPTGDDIIYRSSVYTSSITEIDENVSNMTLFLNDRNGIIERIESEANLTKLEEGEMTDIAANLPDELKSWRSSIISSFDRLMRNLSNSQDRLRNTIDVFNTYRESKRRKSQKRTANTLNLIFSALAIIELSDFVGGLVTYALTHNDSMGALVMFGEALGVLLFFALIIYLLVLRKFWKED